MLREMTSESSTESTTSSCELKIEFDVDNWLSTSIDYQVEIEILYAGAHITTIGYWHSQLHSDYRYGAVLKPRPLFVQNSTMTICPSQVFSPNCFYVHIASEIQLRLMPLMDQLYRLYRGSRPVKVIHPEVDSFWVVEDTNDLLWYRVQVIKVDSQATRATVFYVDWGDVDVVEISKLRPLVPQVMDTPALAIGCSLGCIYPIGKVI